MPRISNRTKMINELVDNFKYELSSLEGKTDKEIEKILDDSKAAMQIVSAVDINCDEKLTEQNETAKQQIPDIWSTEWTQYVLGQLSKDELDKGAPKTDGLRRLTEKLMGIKAIVSNVVAAPNIDNGARATVVVNVTIEDGSTFSGAADVHFGNTERMYAEHPVATAETRAEGRALRRALRLVKVLVAEELTKPENDSEPSGADKRILGGTLNSIKIMGTRTGLDPYKIALYLKFDINDLSDLTQKQALEIASFIGKAERKEIETPEEIKI